MKRHINIFFHNIRKLNRSKKIKYKLRFLVFAFIFISITSFGLIALIKSYAFYNSKVNLALDIKTAMYVIEPGEMSYNIDLDKIIPSDNPYIYTFSISNFNEENTTDVDLEYTLKMQTTTNLPLEYRIYYDSYDLDTNDLISTRELRQDEDGSWYNYYVIDEKYEFSYEENKTNIYYLVIDFPTVYKNVLEYSDAIENIQIIIDSKQIL